MESFCRCLDCHCSRNAKGKVWKGSKENEPNLMFCHKPMHRKSEKERKKSSREKS